MLHPIALITPDPKMYYANPSHRNICHSNTAATVVIAIPRHSWVGPVFYPVFTFRIDVFGQKQQGGTGSVRLVPATLPNERAIRGDTAATPLGLALPKERHRSVQPGPVKNKNDRNDTAATLPRRPTGHRRCRAVAVTGVHHPITTICCDRALREYVRARRFVRRSPQW